VVSAEALERGLEQFVGTVMAVTHDRWFVRSFNRFVVLGEDGAVREVDAPTWEA
jgi:ATPase subunit of ABC transporter with duplicated ATPase domains